MSRHTTWRASIVTVALALSTACAHSKTAGGAVERARLEERQREFLAALSARDADRTAALFADDAVLHVANRPPIDGRAAIRQFYGNVFGFLSASSATPEALRIADSGDMAYGTGATTNEFRGPQGSASFTGKYLLVWRRIGGEWVIAVYSLSSNQPESR